MKDLPERRVLNALDALDHAGLHGALKPTLDLLVLCGAAGQGDPLEDTFGHSQGKRNIARAKWELKTDVFVQTETLYPKSGAAFLSQLSGMGSAGVAHGLLGAEGLPRETPTINGILIGLG